jgi:exopolysaccharide biosynthesis polyprenyl glycosylphosphotransferase
MLKEQARAIAATVFALDLLLVTASFFLTHWLRAALLPEWGVVPGPIYPVGDYLPLLPLALVLWGALLLTSGTYRSHRLSSLAREARTLARVCLLGGLLLTLAAYFLRLDARLLGDDQISRSWIVLMVSVTFGLLTVEKLALRMIARYFRIRGYNYRRVLIVGTNETAFSLAESIRSHRYWGFRVLGFVGDGQTPVEGLQAMGPVLGVLDDLIELTETEAVDEVILTIDLREHERMQEALVNLQELGVTHRFAFDPMPYGGRKPTLSSLDGIPLMTWSHVPSGAWSVALKRTFDIVLATVLLILLSPVMLVVSLVVRLDSPGGALFRQTRAGRFGRPFTLLKFRTMVLGAEDRRDEIAHRNQMSGPVFKIARDPRVTTVGNFLRRFSLDELPQLWNVIRGDMSIVGPRPPIPAEVEHYERWQRRRLSMRPGLTCLWQVSGRSEVDFDRWMELDLEYIDNWSPGLDLQIMLKTIPAILSGRGAL